MQLTLRQLRRLIHETLAGSHPTEDYQHELVDDTAENTTSMLVNDETKKATKNWFKKMGLSTH